MTDSPDMLRGRSHVLVRWMAWVAVSVLGTGSALTGCGEGSVTAAEIDARCGAVCACSSGACTPEFKSSCVSGFSEIQRTAEDTGCDSAFDDWFRCQAEGDACSAGGFDSPACRDEQDDFFGCIQGGNECGFFGECDETLPG
jgi:hypothetical protein